MSTDKISFIIRQHEWIKLEEYRRFMFIKLYLRRFTIKLLLKSPNVTIAHKRILKLVYNSWGFWEFKTKSKQPCLKIGRKHGLNNKHGLYRLPFKRSVDLGEIFNVRKSSF